MAEETEQPTGLSEDDAVTALLGTPSEPDDSEGTPEGDEVTQSEETENTEVDETETEEQPEEEAEAEPEDSEEVAEAEEAPEVEEEPAFTLEDGTEVNLDELKRGYLRQSDYTKKTQQVAAAYKQVQEAQKSRAQERNVLAENLNLALSVIEPKLAELGSLDWEKLSNEDSYQFAEKHAEFQVAQAKYAQLQQASQQVLQQQQAEQANTRKQRLAKMSQQLRMAIPDFADKAKGKELRTRISEYAVKTIGLTPDEVKGIDDARIVVMMDKARRFDELQESSLKVADKKVKRSAGKPLKSGKPKSQADQQSNARKQRMSKFSKSKSVADAVAVLMGT